MNIIIILSFKLRHFWCVYFIKNSIKRVERVFPRIIPTLLCKRKRNWDKRCLSQLSWKKKACWRGKKKISLHVHLHEIYEFFALFFEWGEREMKFTWEFLFLHPLWLQRRVWFWGKVSAFSPYASFFLPIYVPKCTQFLLI